MSSTRSDDARNPPDTSTESPSTSRNRVLEWIRVDGDRLVLTIGISVGIFVLLLVLNAIGVIAFVDGSSITRMASGMIAGTFSLVTLVVSVNQLILSQEFSPTGEHRDRFGGVMEFRRDIEGETDVSTAPGEPTEIIGVLAEAIGSRASALSDSVQTGTDEEFGRRVTRYAETVEDSSTWINDTFDESDVDAFDALSVAIEYSNERYFHQGRRLRNDAPELSAETEAAFDALTDALRLFGTAQEHFKTIYLQRELTKFSQLTIYFGIPAVLSAVLITLLYGDIGGATISSRYLPYVVSSLATVVFAPLVLLGVFILRTATVARRTASVGPMLFQETSDGNAAEDRRETTD